MPREQSAENLLRDVGRHRRRDGAALDDFRAGGRRGRGVTRACDRACAYRGVAGRNISAEAGQIAMVAEGVRAAMRDAGIADPADVHFVQVKCPLLTAQRIGEAQARGAAVATTSTLKSMGLSRAASALGVAVALGELKADAIADTQIGDDWSLLFRPRELFRRHRIARAMRSWCIGMSNAWSGPLIVDHAVMADAIDVEPVRSRCSGWDLLPTDNLAADERERLVAMLAKAEPSQSASLRGFRHTMLDDSDISPTRHARAFVCGALAGLVGHAEIYVSGGAEHQGPDGGGPVAVIARR